MPKRVARLRSDALVIANLPGCADSCRRFRLYSNATVVPRAKHTMKTRNGFATGRVRLWHEKICKRSHAAIAIWEENQKCLKNLGKFGNEISSCNYDTV